MRIGVLSDTHGYLDPRATPALKGVELILHAGDIGSQAIIESLQKLAPVLAVRGNSDLGTPLARQYPEMHWIEREAVRIYLTHIADEPAQQVRQLPSDPARRPHVYIFGHTHLAQLEQIDGVTFLNPGAAGRPRFGGGLSVAILDIMNGKAEARIVPL